MRLGKPPQGLEGDALHTWYEATAEQAAKDEYEGKLHDQREKRRAAEAEASAAQDELEKLKAKVPADGGVALSAEDAARWEKLKKLDPDKVAAERAEAQRIIRTRELEEQAALAGLNPQTFADFALMREIATEVETYTEGEGERARERKRVMVITEADGKTIKTEVGSYLEAQHAGWLPSLLAAPARSDGLTTPPARRLPTDPTPEENPQLELLRRRQEQAKKRTNVFALGMEQG